MRRIIVAALALSPMLLHAQANSPAKTQTSVAATSLQAELVQPKELAASEADHNTTGAASLRISTGVGAPKLIYTVEVASDADFTASAQFERTAVVAMTVDASGKPTDLKIVQSVNAAMDRNILAAVSQYRFTPGTLDNQPVAVPVNLAVVLRHGQ